MFGSSPTRTFKPQEDTREAMVGCFGTDGINACSRARHRGAVDPEGAPKHVQRNAPDGRIHAKEALSQFLQD